MAPVIAALPVIANVLGVVSAAKSLIGGSKGQAAAPAAPAAPPVMPTSDPMKQAQAKMQMTAQRQAAGGRQSTILSSGGTDKLGG